MNTEMLSREPEGWRSHGRPEYRRDYNIKVGLIVRSYGLDISGLGQGPVVCCCEHGSELSGSTKVENFLIRRVTHSFLKNYSALWSYLIVQAPGVHTQNCQNFVSVNVDVIILSYLHLFQCYTVQTVIRYFYFNCMLLNFLSLNYFSRIHAFLLSDQKSFP